jgi:hypothetical protein
MFNVLSSNLHFVCPVAATAMAKRLTINGFWNGTHRREPSTPVAADAWISSAAAYSPRAQEQEDLLPFMIL